MTGLPNSSDLTETRASPAAARAPLLRLFEWRAARPLVFACIVGAIFPVSALFARFVLLGDDPQFPYISFYPAVCLAALLAGVSEVLLFFF